MIRTIAIAVAGFLLLGGATLDRSSEREKSASNVALGRRVFSEVYGEGKVALVDQLYADDFVDDSPGGGKGRELIKEAVTGFHRAFPDLHIEIEDAFSAGDKVVIRYVAQGTQTGSFNGIPSTGKSGKVRGITIFLIENGKIKIEWTEYDRLGLLRQLGVIPG